MYGFDASADWTCVAIDLAPTGNAERCMVLDTGGGMHMKLIL